MRANLFFVGVALAVVAASETFVLLGHVDRSAGTPGLARWRVAFGAAVIVVAFMGALCIGGYVPRPHP